jgi:TRAP transporter TAXI family solute receptor
MKSITMVRAGLLCCLLVSAVWVLDAWAQKSRFVTLGTGGVTGVYYPTGGAIAKLVNDRRDTYGIRMSVESTGGSVYNINAVVGGDLDFGIAQSDLQHHAVVGAGEWADRPQASLRFVMGLHPEIITLMAAEDSGIVTLPDLRGKRVNIGNPGSGNRANAIDVLQAAGMDWKTDLAAESLKAAEAPRLLQDSRLDAFFYTVGHPNGAISEASSGRRKVRFVPITGLTDFLADHPYYSEVTIPTELYPMTVSTGAVASIGVITTLISSEQVPEDVVYAVVKEVHTHFENFRTLHPALERLQPADLLRGRSAPMHPGAERYFREAGLL